MASTVDNSMWVPNAPNSLNLTAIWQAKRRTERQVTLEQLVDSVIRLCNAQNIVNQKQSTNVNFQLFPITESGRTELDAADLFEQWTFRVLFWQHATGSVSVTHFHHLVVQVEQDVSQK